MISLIKICHITRGGGKKNAKKVSLYEKANKCWSLKKQKVAVNETAAFLSNDKRSLNSLTQFRNSQTIFNRRVYWCVNVSFVQLSLDYYMLVISIELFLPQCRISVSIVLDTYYFILVIVNHRLFLSTRLCDCSMLAQIMINSRKSS